MDMAVASTSMVDSVATVLGIEWNKASISLYLWIDFIYKILEIINKQ